MAVGDAHMFPGFLTPVLTQLSFPKPLFQRVLFSHDSAEVRGEKTPEKKFASTADRTHNHQVMSPSRSPLSHPGGALVKGGLFTASIDHGHCSWTIHFVNRFYRSMIYRICHELTVEIES